MSFNVEVTSAYKLLVQEAVKNAVHDLNPRVFQNTLLMQSCGTFHWSSTSVRDTAGPLEGTFHLQVLIYQLQCFIPSNLFGDYFQEPTVSPSLFPSGIPINTINWVQLVMH